MKIKKYIVAICMLLVVCMGAASASVMLAASPTNTSSYTYTGTSTEVALAALGRNSGSHYYSNSVATRTKPGSAVESATVIEYDAQGAQKQILNKKDVCSIGYGVSCDEISRRLGSGYKYKHKAANHNVTNVYYAFDANISDYVEIVVR